MENPMDESRALARYALGNLIHGDASVEAGVRSVLRISRARGNLFWEVWATLQLTEMFEGPDIILADIARGSVAASYSEPTRKETFEKALAAYEATRTYGNATDAYRSDVGDIERDQRIVAADLMRKITLERVEQGDRYHRILNKVKNLVQDYLMTVENGKSESRDHGAFE